MKLKALTLNKLKKEEIMNIKTISNDSGYHNGLYAESKIESIINKNQNKKNKNLFKNNTLFKSLSINTSNNQSLNKKVYPYNPPCSNIKLFKFNYSYKKRPKTFRKLIPYINDENFFCTSKNNKRFLLPKETLSIKNSRINHDINFFNFKNIITDHTKEYEKNSYKIKNVVNQDIFINKIKKDLLRMKYGNHIKLFENI